MSRAYWNGFLKLSFVSCPVALYPATTAAERVSFRQVNRRTGHRLKHQLVDSVTGEAVETHDKARGYEVGAMFVRYWFAARRLGFVIGQDGAITPSI